MSGQITREILDNLPAEFLSRGRWANADLIRCCFGGKRWIIKDFSCCPPPVKKTWGRWMALREYKAYIRLAGLEGIPAEAFLLDKYAVGYRFVPGITLREADASKIPAWFFHELEKLVGRMHERNIVHLDLRNRRNILIDEDGRPYLLDFQSYADLNPLPGFLHNLLKDVDLSGVYKTWLKLRPDLMDERRMAHLKRLNKRRRFWILKGYPLGTRGRRRP